MEDYYERLGVAKDASASSIRSGFRLACLRSHPDKGGTAELFAQVQAAYNTLSNPALRRVYDETIGVQRDGCLGGVGPTSSLFGFEYRRGGVHVEVHGQTQREAAECSGSGRGRKEGARAGQRVDEAEQLTAKIEQGQRDMLARPTDVDLIDRVAVSYLDRAEHHLAAGRRYHAAFDAHEVELLRPEQADTKWRLLNVLKALEDAEGVDEACHDDMISGSDSGVEEWS